MSDLHLEINISDSDVVMFKKAVRHLLDSTFILKEKEEKLYRYVARESNRFEISQYLQAIGFDLLIEEKSGVAMLIISEQDEDTDGIKRSNIIQFSTTQYHLLLVLWQAYLETLGGEGGTFIEMGELVDRLKSYGIDIAGQELKSALKLFKKYMLIHFHDDEKGENAKIRLYPSLQFGWNLDQFKNIAEEYIAGADLKAADETDDDDDDVEEDTEEEDL